MAFWAAMGKQMMAKAASNMAGGGGKKTIPGGWDEFMGGKSSPAIGGAPQEMENPFRSMIMDYLRKRMMQGGRSQNPSGAMPSFQEPPIPMQATPEQYDQGPMVTRQPGMAAAAPQQQQGGFKQMLMQLLQQRMGGMGR
jgi:hypothetical protein